MDHLAQDLSVALEESESCGPSGTMNVCKKWGLRRRTRSTGNLHLCLDKYMENHSDESSSGELDNRLTGFDNIYRKDYISNHHSDSDDMSVVNCRVLSPTHKTNMLNAPRSYNLRNGLPKSAHSTLQRHNARPSIRRKRKLKRMCVDEVPVLPNSGKRKRPQRVEPMITSVSAVHNRIKPLNQSIIDKIEKLRMDSIQMQTSPSAFSTSPIESSFLDLNVGDVSDSSLSWSGDEGGHDGDDELTDWAPQPDPIPNGNGLNDMWPVESLDAREIRAGCRRLYDERPGFSITSGANERIARFMQDTGRIELRLFEGDKEALGQLANLYNLEWWQEGPSIVMRKTSTTPCMQAPQRHHTGLATAHKRIRTHETNRPL